MSTLDTRGLARAVKAIRKTISPDLALDKDPAFYTVKRELRRKFRRSARAIEIADGTITAVSKSGNVFAVAA